MTTAQLLKKIGIGLSVGILLVVFLWHIKMVLLYIIMAYIVSVVAIPIRNLYNKFSIKGFKLPNAFSAFLALFSIFVIASLFLTLIIPVIIHHLTLLSQLDTSAIVAGIDDILDKIQESLDNYNIVLGDGETLKVYLESYLMGLVKSLNIENYVINTLSFMGNLIVAIAATIFIAYFFIRDEHLFLSLLFRFIPRAYHATTQTIIQNITYLLGRYFIGLLIELVIVIVMVSAGLWLIGVKDFLIIGIFVGLFNIIPYLGPIIGGSLGVFIGITSHIHLNFFTELLPISLKMIAVFSVVQLIDNNLLQPFIFANSLNAHPVEIFTVFLIAGTLGGFLGMLIAVPTYIVVRIVAQETLKHLPIFKNW